MTNETKRRIKIYQKALPKMRERIGAAFVTLLIAMVVAVTATYAWVTLSSAPEVSKITTTLSTNGALEIALAKENGEQPDEFDIDESIGIVTDIRAKNLAWGNLVNLADNSYGLENFALRPAQLNSSGLLTSPLWGAVYGEDGRVTKLDTNYAYVVYNGSEFRTNNSSYGVRAIASYTAAIADSTQQAFNDRASAVVDAHTLVNSTYTQVRAKFSALGTMVSKYAQDKLDDADPGTNLAPYLDDMAACYYAVRDAMDRQKQAYVAMADFQNYVYAQNIGVTYTPTTWEVIEANKSSYNAADPDSTSSNGIVSLVGLTQFITDYNKLCDDIRYLEQYMESRDANGTHYYWGSGGVSGHNISNIVADLIDYSTMTIDLDDTGQETVVVNLSADNASSLLRANGKSRKVYVYNGILKRFEQSAVDESYRINGLAACTIKVSYLITITVNGKAYTKATGSSHFLTAYNSAVGASTLVANDSVAQDTYGLVLDLWFRSNAEETCLTLEGAVVTDEDNNVIRYDGVNRIWGSTGNVALTTESTTQGGGSCYVYYADTPEDMQRSLDLLDAMRVAFVDSEGQLLAEAEMDTKNNWASYGRITVPLVLDTNTQTTYTFFDETNEEQLGRAITTLYLDQPQRITAIVYLDGTRLQNTNVLAEAEIQGQLNLQFASSERLNTVGDNKLITEIRSVTASLNKYALDYDTAITSDDMTAEVTVSVTGNEPQVMTAFFVRAINDYQGTREQSFSLTKQENGTWKGNYQFHSPGTYYLRHIRMDGVDYALAEPQKVEISGFGLTKLTWSEGLTDRALIQTSDSSYSETVSVALSTHDRTRMPRSMSAIFLRDNGNSVSVPLTYSSATGEWSGTKAFDMSGTYTLQYVLMDENYVDLEKLGMVKVLELSLGIYVDVRQGAASLTDQYEPGTTYEKDVIVRILDNAGKEIEGIQNAVLYYSNGGSASGTVSGTLEWEEENGYYTTTMAIRNPGRYRFSSVAAGTNYLTKCVRSPIYAIISPDPPTFNSVRSVGSSFGTLQFAPLTLDAVIDRITIDHGEAADITAVVYNDRSGKYYTLRSRENEITFNNDSWTAKLPPYTLDVDALGEPLENARYTQEGTWSLISLSLAGCFDADTVMRDETNPIIWVGTDAASEAYLNDADITPDARISFSKLATTVSCTIRVSMSAGNTELGGADDEFMSSHTVDGIGMYVLITDDAGNVIPASKISSVDLFVDYQPSETDGSYGYRVSARAAKGYDIVLNAQDPESGQRRVGGNKMVNGTPVAYSPDDWQYVGLYSVSKLTVTLNSSTQMTYFPADGIGIPAQYTLTTKGPSASDVSFNDDAFRQQITEFGKSGSTVNGLFLQSYDPSVIAGVRIGADVASSTQYRYVLLDGVTMSLELTHTGHSSDYGGYTFSYSGLQEISVPMNKGEDGYYRTISTSLLAGTYSAVLKAEVGGETITKVCSDISVYSMKPSLTGIVNEWSGTYCSYDGENQWSASKKLKSNSGYKNYIISGQNSFNSDTNTCTVYIPAVDAQTTVSGSKYYCLCFNKDVDSVNNSDKGFLPTVQMKLDDVGSFSKATVELGGKTWTFDSGNSLSNVVTVGDVNGYVSTSQCGNVYYTNKVLFGTYSANTITIEKAGDSYTVSLMKQVTVSNPH